jgi:CheY-like chemotaxis protein
MDEETKSHIFEPFFTTKGVGKGTGLGLSMVQGIVAQSGGHIEVSSQPGRGTTFRIYLPALDGQEASPSTPAPAAALGGHETLLVVEDQPEVRKYAVAVLQAKGYRVISANHAAEALLSCERDPIDLVLTDVIMPNMSGRELVDQLRNRRPGIQVLFMSGYTGNIIEHHGVLDQLENFIQKPFSAEDLAAKVRSVLDRALTSPPSADKFRRKP